MSDPIETKKNVLVVVVEDNVESNNLLRDWLLLKYQVASFLDAESTLRQLEPKVNPRIFLIDYNLPGENGIWLRRRLATYFSTAKFILISGLFDQRLREQSLSEGFHALLSKPFSMPLLAQTIDALLGLPGKTNLVDLVRSEGI